MGHNLVALIDDRLNGFKMPEPANATGSLLTPKLAAWPLRGVVTVALVPGPTFIGQTRDTTTWARNQIEFLPSNFHTARASG